jgi:hypothetical protein
MGQQGPDSKESELPARRGRVRVWLRSIAACALALTLGFGQAYADPIASAHEGGQGRDKHNSAFASAEAFAGDGGPRASSSRSADAFGSAALDTAQRKAEAAKVTVTVDVEETGIGTDAWTRTVTRTYTSRSFVASVTNSKSYAIDEEGNRAIAKAVARARAPNSVAAVRNGAGNITAKTSVDVVGNGVASADAGGSIGIGGGVKVSTWGRTSAEVF